MIDKLKNKKILYLIAILLIIWIVFKIIAFLVGVVSGILYSWYGLATAVGYSSSGGYDNAIETKIFLVLFII